MSARRINPSLTEALMRPLTPSQFIAEHPYRVEGQRWKLGIRWVEEYRIVHCSCIKTAEDVAAKTGMVKSKGGV